MTAHVGSVADSELLARFVTSSRWIRSSDNTIRQDAFIPHPYPDLSVTRHKDLSPEQIWRIGTDIANARPVPLYGRADLSCFNVRRQKLFVEPRPTPENLNHASITGWPLDKPAQKILAQELAAAAVFVTNPKLLS